MQYRLTRRQALAGVVVGTALSGCSASDGSTVSVPTPSSTPDECVTLETFDFRHQGHCKPLDAPDDADLLRFDFPGAIVSDGSQLMAYFRNAVLAWEVATGVLRSLHAPQRADSWVFAARGNTCVVPRCDATLAVHADGCVAVELTGHAPRANGTEWLGDGIQSLVFTADDHLVSLGTDNTLRSWRASTGEALELQRLDSRAEMRTMWYDAADDRLLVSHDAGRAADVYDSTTLEHTRSFPELPEVDGPWRLTTQGLFAGLGPAGADEGIVLFDSSTGERTDVSTRDRCRALAVSADGEVAFEDGNRIRLRAPDGSEREFATPGSEYISLAYSDNGELMHALDAHLGPVTFDVATGEVFTTYQLP